MVTQTQLIRQLRSPDNKIVLRAVEELRARGCLEDGTLAGINLQFIHLQSADLHKTNLQNVNLSMADMRWTNLTGADLQKAQLNNTNLYRANLHMVNLRGANLIKANLQDTRNLSDDQLAQVNRLKGATMPDGSRYDGRFYLAGDVGFARSRGIDINNPLAMAEYYGISKPRRWDKATDTRLSTNSDMQLIHKLRSSNNELVIRAVEELRKRGRLGDGTLEWVCLRYAHLQGADLSTSNLYKADLSMADLQEAKLAYAHLEGTKLIRANLRGVDLHKAEMQGAILTNVNLQAARNLRSEQLSQTSRLRGAMMPDGSRYDGRFNLEGDLADARFWNVNLNHPEAMANYYGISLEDYICGQQWLHQNMPGGRACDEVIHADAETAVARFFELEHRILDFGTRR